MQCDQDTNWRTVFEEGREEANTASAPTVLGAGDQGGEMRDESCLGEMREQLEALRAEVANPKHDSVLRNSRCDYILRHIDSRPQQSVIKCYDTITGKFFDLVNFF